MTATGEVFRAERTPETDGDGDRRPAARADETAPAGTREGKSEG